LLQSHSWFVWYWLKIENSVYKEDVSFYNFYALFWLLFYCLFFFGTLFVILVQTIKKQDNQLFGKSVRITQKFKPL